MFCNLWDSGKGLLPPDINNPIISSGRITSLEFSRISHYRASASRKKHTFVLCQNTYMQDRYWMTEEDMVSALGSHDMV